MGHTGTGWSLRAQLLGVVGLVAGPLAALLAYNLHRELSDNRAQAATTVVALADLAAAHTRRYLDDSEEMLHRVAWDPALVSGDAGACARALRQAARATDAVVVTDGEGAVTCALAPASRPAPARVDPGAWLSAARREGAFVAGEPVRSPATGRWEVALALPLYDPGGRFAGAVAILVDLENFRIASSGAWEPPGAVMTIGDRAGRAVARSTGSSAFVGADIRDQAAYRHFAAGRPGPVTGRGLDGVERIHGISPVHGTDWFVSVGLPTAEVFAPARARSARSAIVAALIVGLALLAGAMAARRIEGPVRALAELAGAVTRGDRGRRAVPAGSRETAALAGALNGMLDSLELSLARERGLFEGALDLIHFVDAGGRIVDANPAECRALGYAREEIVGRPLLDLVAPAQRGATSEALAGVLRGRTVTGYETSLVRRDGAPVIVEVNAFPERDGDRIVGARAVMRDVGARREAERRERDLLRRLESVMESMHDAFVALDRQWTYTYVNGKAAALFGREPGALVGRHIWTEFPEGVGQPFHLAYERVMATGRGESIEAHYAPLDKWFENRIYATAEGIAIFFTDVTERKRQEDAVRQSERKLEAAFQASPNSIMITSAATGRIVDANDALVRFTGIPREALIGRPVEGRGIWVDPAAREAYRRKVLETGAVDDLEALFRRADGTEATALISARRVEIGGETCILAVARDITDRKRAEEALREGALRLRLAAQAGNIGFWDWDLRTGDVYFSPEWKSQVGCADDEIGNAFAEWESRVHPEDLPEAMRRVRDYLDHPAGAHEIEFRLRHKDGSWRRILARAAVVAGADARPVRMLGVHVDVTEMRVAEEARLANAARVEALTRKVLAVQEEERRALARELHDEIGQVLTAIRLNLKAVQRHGVGVRAAEAVADSLAIVERAIGQVRSLSLELRPPLLDELGLAAALRSMCERQGERAGIAVELAIEPADLALDPAPAAACYRIVQEALTNVARHAGATRARVKVARAGSRVEIEVEDDGAGFDPAPTPRGSGLLGMEERARLLGGDLAVRSVPGAGTAVRATFEASP